MSIPNRTLGEAAALTHLRAILAADATDEVAAAFTELTLTPAPTFSDLNVRIGDEYRQPLTHAAEIRVVSSEFVPSPTLTHAEGRGEYRALVRIYNGPTARNYTATPTHQTDTEIKLAAMSGAIRALIERRAVEDYATTGIYSARVERVSYADVYARASTNTILIRRAELRVLLNVRHRQSRGLAAP